MTHTNLSTATQEAATDTILSSTLSKIKNFVFFIWQKLWLFGKYFFHVAGSQ
ncbi:hypothetical protein VB735_25540 [Halotia wernerae UHCC 0503]|nr:hypothetical protein [Halotia wernerae UHCC 0503]